MGVTLTRSPALVARALLMTGACGAGSLACAGSPPRTLAACPALQQPTDAAPAGMRLRDAKPLGGSRLLSFPDDRFQVGALDDGSRRQALAWLEQGQPPRVLATLAPPTDRQGASQVVLYRPSGSGDARGHAEMALSSIEHLYALALLQNRAGRFGLALGKPPAGARPLSAGELLATLAHWRECAARDLEQAAGTKVEPWDRVSLTPRPFLGPQRLRVSAEVRVPGQPVVGADVSFERGDHLACLARTDARGIAACTLFDSHRHEDHGEARQATVIGFSGQVGSGRIAPPTTSTVP